MRLVHKNLRHTGYIIVEGGGIIPAFTQDLLNEAKMVTNKRIKGVYGAQVIMKETLSSIKKYYKDHKIVPQDLTEELRTGFSSGRGLTQSYPRYYYK